MRILLHIAAFAVALTVTAQASANDEEIPAKPLNRRPPNYPAACLPAPGEEKEPQTVTISFGVTNQGLPENVRVLESSDPCFEEAAIAAVRSWKYEPRRANGRPQAQEDLETTFTFIFEESTNTEDFDARPLVRFPPRYPERCLRHAETSETVTVEFDVTTEGTTENIRSVDSTNSCFEREAERAVAKWRYRPKILSGKPVARKGVITQITFELADDVSPEYEIRGAVRKRLERVRHSLRRKDDPQKILSELASIEAEYGDTFSHAELKAFHQIRAIARIEAGDYAGALDDLRIVQRMGLSSEAAETIAKTIIQLEMAIAAQEAKAEQPDDKREQSQ